MYNDNHFKEVEGCADVFNYHFTSFERPHDFKGVIYFYHILSLSPHLFLSCLVGAVLFYYAMVYAENCTKWPEAIANFFVIVCLSLPLA